MESEADAGAQSAAAAMLMDLAQDDLPGSDENMSVEASIKAQLVAGCETVLKQHGGPSQYLTSVLSDAAEAEEFLQYLWHEFPESDEVLYTHSKTLPVTDLQDPDFATAVPLCIHVSMLGFTPDASLKPPCGIELGGRLLQQYMAETFITSGDPLLVVQQETDVCPHNLTGPWDSGTASGGIKPFNLAFVKGYARSSTLLMVLHRMKVQGLDVTVLKDFHESVQKIHVHCLKPSSRLDEALTNCKLSARGSLRKQNNTIQIVMMLRKLSKCGGLSDASTFIKRWNKMSAKTFQIGGRRFSSLKLLLDQTPQDHVFRLFCCVGMTPPPG